MFPVHRSVLIAAALTVPFALNTSVGLAEAPGQAGVRVTLSDLNLSTQSGVRTLYNRIHSAASRYCESIYSRTGSRIAAGYAGCVVDAVNNTVRSLNLPALTALHQEHASQQKKS